MAAARLALDTTDGSALRRFVTDLDRTTFYSRDHSANVADLVVMIHRELGTPEHEVRRRYIAALLHDIGKTAVPSAILGKPSELTDSEYDVIKSHPRCGADVVAAVEGLGDLALEILHHHERVDGSGYPDGLADDQIPFAARVLAVADAFDAMTSERLYCPARGRIDAVEELVRCAGTQLDGSVVAAFLAALARSATSARRSTGCSAG